MYLPREAKTFFLLLSWRLISVFVVQTAHVPDEYWQALEVAHRLAFGYGYLTWEWTAHIRSYLYPFFLSLLYRILAFMSLDHVEILITLPRLVQAVISAYGDYRFYQWTKNKWTLYSLCINWYWYYCATRTLINTIETTCTIIALSIFPWRDSNIRHHKFLWIVGVLCMARPTAAIIWLPLCLYHFSTSAQNKLILAFQYATTFAICFIVCLALDCYCYGTFVIPPWEFFQVNVLRQIGNTYGTEHMLWYIFSGLPVLLGVQCVFFLYGAWQTIKHPSVYHRQAVMLVVICWTISCYSLLSHKEFRFLLPLLPMLIYISTSCSFRPKIRITEYVRKLFIALIISSNIFPGLYFSLIHQRGSLDTMKVLRNEIVEGNGTSLDILFLTPCHAIPLYSHLHTNVSVRFLTCEPNLKNSTNYIDEADEFFAQPMSWLLGNYIDNESIPMPTHVVVFDNVLPKISKFLINYTFLDEIFYTHFPQSNYGNYVLLYKHK